MNLLNIKFEPKRPLVEEWTTVRDLPSVTESPCCGAKVDAYLPTEDSENQNMLYGICNRCRSTVMKFSPLENRIEVRKWVEI